MLFCFENGSRRALKIAFTFLQQRLPGRARDHSRMLPTDLSHKLIGGTPILMGCPRSRVRGGSPEGDQSTCSFRFGLRRKLKLVWRMEFC